MSTSTSTSSSSTHAMYVVVNLPFGASAEKDDAAAAGRRCDDSRTTAVSSVSTGERERMGREGRWSGDGGEWTR